MNVIFLWCTKALYLYLLAHSLFLSVSFSTGQFLIAIAARDGKCNGKKAEEWQCGTCFCTTLISYFVRQILRLRSIKGPYWYERKSILELAMVFHLT